MGGRDTPPKFKEGDVVFEITHPQQMMLVTRREGFMYFCRPLTNDKEHGVAFMERDLKREQKPTPDASTEKT